MENLRLHTRFAPTPFAIQYIQPPLSISGVSPLAWESHGLLTVENDFAVVGVLKPGLEAEDQAADWARNTEQSMSLLRGREYHAAIVDLRLPEGLALVRQTTLMNGPVLKLAGDRLLPIGAGSGRVRRGRSGGGRSRRS